ncbi:uncharacterized protein LOC111555844 [Piliocolobus tephrosceles]|uniref:uncharacterized protein LOC111555844 n=1 Tax=Piliocolobus tephrosceles TaxID=591936 RepID=UPI000C2B0220|nr:uncharacterized protein LOC111555844 [Piliocolobus tephrosceles]
MASGLEGRLRPGFLDCKGDPQVGGAGSSRSEPFAPECLARTSSCAPGITEQRGAVASGGRNERGGRSTGPKGAVMGWVAGPGKWGGDGLGKTWPSPAALKTTPVYLGAGQETFRLPLPPCQTVGRGMGREWAWGWDLPPEFPPDGGSAQGGVICLPCHGVGIPSRGPRPLSREGILGEAGPRSRPCPQPPQTHPNLKAMRVRVYRNHVQSPEKPPTSPREKKKTRQKLIYIFCIWSSVLNINCVIFIHFLSLNSPLIYQFNVSWGFFSHGVLCPHPQPFV